MRSAISRRMVESKSKAPHFYVTTEIDMEAVTAANAALNHDRSGDDRVTITAWLVRAVAQSLAAAPELNAVWNGETLERIEQINIGITVQGRYVVNQTPTAGDPAVLSAELKRAAGETKDPVITISADAQASHQSVIRVMEAAQFAGYGKIAFAIQAAKK